MDARCGPSGIEYRSSGGVGNAKPPYSLLPSGCADPKPSALRCARLILRNFTSCPIHLPHFPSDVRTAGDDDSGLMILDTAPQPFGTCIQQLLGAFDWLPGLRRQPVPSQLGQRANFQGTRSKSRAARPECCEGCLLWGIGLRRWDRGESASGCSHRSDFGVAQRAGDSRAVDGRARRTGSTSRSEFPTLRSLQMGSNIVWQLPL